LRPTANTELPKGSRPPRAIQAFSARSVARKSALASGHVECVTASGMACCTSHLDEATALQSKQDSIEKIEGQTRKLC
jgi:hypothetical protein